jgi:hypothetical protein
MDEIEWAKWCEQDPLALCHVPCHDHPSHVRRDPRVHRALALERQCVT